MLRTSESETEILLGNTQLLGIFFVVALLLAVSFYGGYMVGRGGTARKPLVAVAGQGDGAVNPTSSGNGGETHVVSAGGTGVASDAGGETKPEASANGTEEALGSRKRKASPRAETRDTAASGSSASSPLNTEESAAEGFAPQVGEQFLQVAAEGREGAEAVADVLHKKGFRAHAVPKPGNPKIYRVIVGPIRDTADLSSTREALVRTGFREVILQRY